MPKTDVARQKKTYYLSALISFSFTDKLKRQTKTKTTK